MGDGRRFHAVLRPGQEGDDEVGQVVRGRFPRMRKCQVGNLEW